MPHITLECTSNVEMDFQAYFKELAEMMVRTGHASALGIKCRKVISDDFYIVDGNADYKMINLLFRLREGRSDEVLQCFSHIGISLLEKYMNDEIEAKKVILSTEIKELKKGLDLTKNSIR